MGGAAGYETRCVWRGFQTDHSQTRQSHSLTVCQFVSSLQSTQLDLVQQILQLHLLVDDLENCNLKHNIRIRGLPEEMSQSDLKFMVTAIFNKYLDHTPLSEITIDRVYRALGSQNASPYRLRNALCRLHSYTLKEENLQRAWHLGTIYIDDVQIHLQRKILALHGYNWLQWQQINFLPDVFRKTLQMHRGAKGAGHFI